MIVKKEYERGAAGAGSPLPSRHERRVTQGDLLLDDGPGVRLLPMTLSGIPTIIGYVAELRR